MRASVEIDVRLLERVKEVLGTETITETIDAAFREVIRASSARKLVELAEYGAYGALLEPDVEKRMWDDSGSI